MSSATCSISFIDGPARSTVLRVYGRAYTKVVDVMTGATQDPSAAIAVGVDGCSGLWLPCEKSDSH